MSACSDISYDARAVHAELMLRATGHGNDQALACMIATWAFGGGALPSWLGLSSDAFDELLALHFPGASISPPSMAAAADGERSLEFADLQKLMVENRANESLSEIWMADIVASACMGSDHLWQDLGLWSRGDLTALMQRNFPALAARNDRDMKWKKFLYKQLCETEGIYVCRSPSCEVCADYANCFGPEE